MTVVDGRRARGARSRGTIMRLAVNAASVNGLDGLSIGALAADSELSKSGVVALFGSKEELQLATIAAAREIFRVSVVVPTLATPGGLERVETLLASWLDYSRTRVFAGGCFFAAAIVEVGSKPGPVRDAVAVAVDDWYTFVSRTVARAQSRGEIRADLNPDELGFALTSYLETANSRSLIGDSSEPYELAAAAIRTLLGVARP